MNQLQTSIDDLRRNYSSLFSAWSSTRAQWKDSDADHFEREHIHELQQAAQIYIASLQKLSETVQGVVNRLP